MANLATGIWRDRVGTVVIAVLNEIAPTDAEWDKWVANIRQALMYPDVLGAVAITDRGGPNAAQRAKVNEVLKNFSTRPTLSAVVSSALVIRGVVAALRVFNPTTHSFSPQEIVKAMSFIKIAESQRAGLWKKVMELDAQITPRSKDVATAALCLSKGVTGARV